MLHPEMGAVSRCKFCGWLEFPACFHNLSGSSCKLGLWSKLELWRQQGNPRTPCTTAMQPQQLQYIPSGTARVPSKICYCMC